MTSSSVLHELLNIPQNKCLRNVHVFSIDVHQSWQIPRRHCPPPPPTSVYCFSLECLAINQRTERKDKWGQCWTSLILEMISCSPYVGNESQSILSHLSRCSHLLPVSLFPCAMFQRGILKLQQQQLQVILHYLYKWCLKIVKSNLVSSCTLLLIWIRFSIKRQGQQTSKQ